MGMERKKASRPSMNSEPVSSSTNQPCATCCIQNATWLPALACQRREYCL